ncbi:iron-siderophore ABC transporter substrate-binding protein [Sulfitobacter aestuarii]|uniref:Iron-siderophore ABC transporter substrate-binding protein n=1 Tax=Sulfitobacter aestuarii TaxID=2161676 RepID=A0ABW5U5P7_9RHOB
MIRLLILTLSLLANPLGAATAPERHEKQGSAQVPERIVVLDWALTEQLLDLGITPVGAPELALYREWVIDPALPESVADIGLRSEPNLEQIASLAPDLILASDLDPAQLARLERVAPVRVFEAFSKDHDNIAAARDIFETIAQLTGRAALAEARISAMTAELSALRQSLFAAFNGEVPSVAVVRLRDDAGVWIYGANSMPAAALEALGIQNALPQPPSRWGAVQRPLSALIEVGTGAVIAIRPHMAGTAVFDTPIWRHLPAVQADRFAEAAPVWSYGGYLSLLRHARVFTQALQAMSR